MAKRVLMPALESIRNIGVSAHVDAGKTTVVERMLFFANKTKSIGEVHDGAATMDYLPQERERGITINAAAVSFPWRDDAYRVNLLDTPGHADFTVEVERSMRVLDGSIICFDGVAGVEAQTETVWRQAERYGVPRIGFINKLDRPGANADKVCETIRKRLNCEPLLLQLPIGEAGSFRGCVDLVASETLTWEDRGGISQGREFERRKWGERELAGGGGFPTLARIREAQERMYEKIADADDEFAEAFLGSSVNHDVVRAAVRRLVARQVVDGPTKSSSSSSPPQRTIVFPLLMGAALKNIGIQPLLDAVIDYLPDPLAKNTHAMRTAFSRDSREAITTTTPLAFVFKIQNDPNRGPLAFVRVYNGELNVRDGVVVLSDTSAVSSKQPAERLQQLLRAEAGEFKLIQEGVCRAGDVCVLVGCRSLRTGDTLTRYPVPTGARAAPRALPRLTIPPTVFSVALELESATQEEKLRKALETATRDDPSLTWIEDAETGQTLLGGVGELHLDVSVDRLKREHGLIGLGTSPPRIARKETILGSAHAVEGRFKGTVGGAQVEYVARVSLERLESSNADHDETTVRDPTNRVEIARDSCLRASSLLREAALAGAEAGLSRGQSKNGLPVIGVRVYDVILMEVNGIPTADAALHLATTSDGGGEGVAMKREDPPPPPTSMLPQAVRAAVHASVSAALRECVALPLEPAFEVEAEVPEARVGDVLGDLTGRRRASVLSVDASPSIAGRVVIRVCVPVAETLHYSSTLRSLTGGMASYTCKFDKYVAATGR